MDYSPKKGINEIAQQVERERVNMGSIHYVLLGQLKAEMHKALKENDFPAYRNTVYSLWAEIRNQVKNAYPPGWDDEKIMEEIKDVDKLLITQITILEELSKPLPPAPKLRKQKEIMETRNDILWKLDGVRLCLDTALDERGMRLPGSEENQFDKFIKENDLSGMEVLGKEYFGNLPKAKISKDVDEEKDEDSDK